MKVQVHFYQDKNPLAESFQEQCVVFEFDAHFHWDILSDAEKANFIEGEIRDSMAFAWVIVES